MKIRFYLKKKDIDGKIPSLTIEGKTEEEIMKCLVEMTDIKNVTRKVIIVGPVK